MRKHYYKYTKQFGLTILEALISTAIVGIGFVAILQMVNFSVQSVDSSGERTKANFFVSMLAEDVISHRYTIDGRNENDLAEDLSTNPWRSEGDESRICARQRSTTHTALTDTPDDIYGDQVDSDTSIDNKKNKWQRIFKDDQFLKCKSDRDVKRMKVFKILVFIILGFLLIRNISNGYDNIEINNTSFKVKIAENPSEWKIGLSGTANLEEKEGMLFIFPILAERSFYMKNMNFAIDLLWIKDNIIVGMEKNMLPDNGEKYYDSVEEIDMVLELKAGSIDNYNLNIGNIIKIN